MPRNGEMVLCHEAEYKAGTEPLLTASASEFSKPGTCSIDTKILRHSWRRRKVAESEAFGHRQPLPRGSLRGGVVTSEQNVHRRVLRRQKPVKEEEQCALRKQLPTANIRL